MRLMITQRFETIPDDRKVMMMADILRYENASLKANIATLEKEVKRYQNQLDEALDLLEEIQKIIDMQNAKYFVAAIEQG